MRMTGEQRIDAPRARVWEALNDPEVLRQAIPGCQSLDKEGDDRFRALVEVKIGPIGARFNGAVALSDVDPANGYTITGEGQGGTVGSAKGAAKVRLSDDAGGTLLRYEVDAQVGGRLAQLGGPIIDSTAKRLADQFFRRFGEIVASSGAAAAAPAYQAPASTERPTAIMEQPRRTVSSLTWLIALVLGLLVGFVIGHSGDLWLQVGISIAVVALLAFVLGRMSGSGGRP